MTRHVPRGFTVLEVLLVIAIIGLLSATMLTSLRGGYAAARDADRVAMLDAGQNALELFYNDHDRFLIASGQDFFDWEYYKAEDGQCQFDEEHKFEWHELRFDNSTSRGFLRALDELGYLSEGEWMDMLAERQQIHGDSDAHGSKYNCRYVIPCKADEHWSDEEFCAETNDDGECIEGDTEAYRDAALERTPGSDSYCNPQEYLFHCNLEQKTALEERDDGPNDNLYEVYSPGEKWVCACHEEHAPCPDA